MIMRFVCFDHLNLEHLWYDFGIQFDFSAICLDKQIIILVGSINLSVRNALYLENPYDVFLNAKVSVAYLAQHWNFRRSMLIGSICTNISASKPIIT